MSRVSSVPPAPAPEPLSDEKCQYIESVLTCLSEDFEANIFKSTGEESNVDDRLVFLLYAALSDDPLLTLSEYDECDDWCDWLHLGFSDSTIDAFERDINRPGSQSMGLLFHLFFVLHFPHMARLSTAVIRNVHFEPSALYGLFSVNCAKWTRDSLLSSIGRFDKVLATRSGGVPTVPPLVDTAKGAFFEYRNFLSLVDFWISNDGCGSIDRLEMAQRGGSNSIHHLPQGTYASFSDQEDDDGDHMTLAGRRRSPPVGRQSVSSPGKKSSRHVSFKKSITSRIPSLVELSNREEFEFFKQIIIVGGLYYSYCMLLFTKFWIENGLIQVDADIARERLNNQFLETQFVCKLQVTCSMSTADLQKRIGKTIETVANLWSQTGWSMEDLLGQHSPNSHAGDTYGDGSPCSQ